MRSALTAGSKHANDKLERVHSEATADSGTSVVPNPATTSCMIVVSACLAQKFWQYVRGQGRDHSESEGAREHSERSTRAGDEGVGGLKCSACQRDEFFADRGDYHFAGGTLDQLNSQAVFQCDQSLG